MMRSENRTVTLLAVIALAFTCGIAYLFALRYRSGDIYPVYSSLRADPLGTKAFYESLARCGRLMVSRNHEDILALNPGPDTTILWLGDTISSGETMDGGTIGALNRFIRKGGRVVFTFLPANRKKAEEAEEAREPEQPDEATEPDETEKSEPANVTDEDKAGDGSGRTRRKPAGIPVRGPWPVRVEDWLGTGVDHAYIDRGNALTPEPWPQATLAPDMVHSGLPRSVSCHTSLHFVEPAPGKCAACLKAEREASAAEDDVTSAECTCGPAAGEQAPYPWRTIYERAGKPVIVERSLGKGTIVLSALSYFTSNEAMRDERHAGLLVWLVGSGRNVIFDETHHGIVKQRGVAGLARRYRLHWPGLGLLLLAGLFVWKSSSCLAPPDGGQPGGVAGPTAVGKDSASGLLNLLRRNVRRGDILATCLAAYRQSLGRTDRRMDEKLTRITELVEEEKARPARRKNSAGVYNEICSVLKRK